MSGRRQASFKVLPPGGRRSRVVAVSSWCRPMVGDCRSLASAGLRGILRRTITGRLLFWRFSDIFFPEPEAWQDVYFAGYEGVCVESSSR